MSPNTLLLIILGIIILNFLIDTALDILNASRFRDPIPQNLQDVMDTQEYKKSQRYKTAVFRFGLLSSTYLTAITILFILFGGFSFIDDLARDLFDHPILIGLTFFGLLFIGSDILTLPFSYYRTFNIEARFGFNKTTKKTFFLDKLKGWALMFIMGGGILALIIWFYKLTGANFWWYAWILISLFSIFTGMFYSRLIVPLFNKQQPLPKGSLRSKIEAYAQQEGFELENIFVIDGSKRSTKANAYFSGFGKEKRVTLYDTLIADLEEEEIVGVLAHEIGHYKKNHIIVTLCLSIINTGLTLWLLSLLVNSPVLSAALGVEEPSFHVSLVAFALLYGPLADVTDLLMNYLSRKFEYQADNYAKITYDRAPLISGLKKLSRNNLSNLNPHPAYVFVNYSHPPLSKRLENLDS